MSNEFAAKCKEAWLHKAAWKWTLMNNAGVATHLKKKVIYGNKSGTLWWASSLNLRLNLSHCTCLCFCTWANLHQMVFEAKKGGAAWIRVPVSPQLTFSSRSPLRNLSAQVWSGQQKRREPPWAQLAVSCCTLKAVAVMFWHPGKRKSEVKQPNSILCWIQCLGPRLQFPQFWKKTSLSQL